MPEGTQQQAGNMEHELAKHSELAAAIIAAMPDGVMLFDMDGKIVAVNPAVEKMNGYTSDELVQRNAADVVAQLVKPEDLERVLGGLRTNLDGKASVLAPFTFITKGGQEVTTSFSVAFIKDAQGKPIYILATLKDMTEFKRDEEERNERVRDLDFLSKVTMEIVELPLENDIYKFAAEKLQLLVGDSIVSVSAYDKVTNNFLPRAFVGLGKYSDSIVKLLGASPFAMSFKMPYSEKMSEMTTSRLTKIPGGLYGASFGQIPRVACQAIEKLLNVGDIHGIGLRREKQLFGTILIYWRRGTAELRPGIIETFVNQVSVILERNQTNEKRVEAMKERAAIIDGMPDALIELDLNGTILCVNPAYTTMVGAKAEDVMGIHYNKLQGIKPDDIERISQLLGELIKTGHVEPIEIVFCRSDGREISLSGNCSMTNDTEGKPKKIIVVLRDVTERKRAAEKEKELVTVAAEAAVEKKRVAELDKAYQELREKNEQLKRFHRVAVGQELEMVRLEEEVNTLLEKSGLPGKYKTPEKIRK